MTFISSLDQRSDARPEVHKQQSDTAKLAAKLGLLFWNCSRNLPINAMSATHMNLAKASRWYAALLMCTLLHSQEQERKQMVS